MRDDEKLIYIDLELNRKIVLEPRLGDNHFWLSSVEGLDGLDNDIYTVKGSGQDGVTKTGSNLQPRVVTVTGSLRLNPETSKRQMLRVMNPGHDARLVYQNRYGSWYLDGQIKTAPRFTEAVLIPWQFVFYAPYPFLRLGDGDVQRVVDIALWVPNFEMNPYFEIPIEDEMIIEYRAPELIVNVINEGDVESGMVIEFRATGTTGNPSLINVLTQERFWIDTDMQPGDVIKVWTGYGEKRAIRFRSGLETNIFNDIPRDVVWLQLHVGDNLLRYDADVIDNIEVSIYPNDAFLGVG